jgi:hypothetical protein
MSGNLLTGWYPSGWNKIEEVVLFHNKLSGTIPDNIGQSGALNDLHLAGNMLSGTLPSSLAASGATMDYLSVEDMHLSGTLPSDMGSLNKLTQWWSSSNRMSGTLPASLTRLRKLESLYIEKNNIRAPSLRPSATCTPEGRSMILTANSPTRSTGRPTTTCSIAARGTRIHRA